SSIKCSVYELHARPSHPIAPAWEAHLDSVDLKSLKAIPKDIDAIGHRRVIK
ncbi:MAG: hypothetical protein JSS32_05285, partial [Verrucomicrobia bacterium]|nr:hypothetical protein [Verrucomicrobiota bacterium]